MSYFKQNGKYIPSCQSNRENQLFQYCSTRRSSTVIVIEIVCTVTRVGIYGEIKPEPLGNPFGIALKISLGLRLYIIVYLLLSQYRYIIGRLTLMPTPFGEQVAFFLYGDIINLSIFKSKETGSQVLYFQQLCLPLTKIDCKLAQQSGSQHY